MLMPRQSFNALRPASSQYICLSCRRKYPWQDRNASSNRPRAKPPAPKAMPHIPAKGPAPILKPLSRPIGVDEQPRIGDNRAKDPRSWYERFIDYWGKSAHEERRRILRNDLSRPYFIDWARMRHHKGKTFIAPASLLKSDMAKYFPNMQGYTLADSWNYQDTTKVLRDKVSIVSVVSETWAEWQALSFVGKKENPELANLVEEFKGKGLQEFRINIEDDAFKGFLVYWCLPWARSKTSKENWHRSFVVRKGVDIELKEKIGMTNGKVGFVFLLDQNCRIRWVGNGYASDEERASLVKLARKLVEDRSEAPEKRPVARRLGKEGIREAKMEKVTALGSRRPLVAVN